MNDALLLFAAIGSVLFAAYLLYLTVWAEGRDWTLDAKDGPEFLDVYASMSRRARR